MSILAQGGMRSTATSFDGIIRQRQSLHQGKRRFRSPDEAGLGSPFYWHMAKSLLRWLNRCGASYVRRLNDVLSVEYGLTVSASILQLACSRTAERFYCSIGGSCVAVVSRRSGDLDRMLSLFIVTGALSAQRLPGCRLRVMNQAEGRESAPSIAAPSE